MSIGGGDTSRNAALTPTVAVNKSKAFHKHISPGKVSRRVERVGRETKREDIMIVHSKITLS